MLVVLVGHGWGVWRSAPSEEGTARAERGEDVAFSSRCSNSNVYRRRRGGGRRAGGASGRGQGA